MATTRPSPALRERLAYLSDWLLIASAAFIFGGTLLITNSHAWFFTISLWVIGLYFFVASVILWIRKG